MPRARASPDLPETPSDTARRLYYDTVCYGSQAAFYCAYQAFGEDHLVAGSDYPVLMNFKTYARTFNYIRESALPPEAIDKDPQPQRADRPGAGALGFTKFFKDWPG